MAMAVVAAVLALASCGGGDEETVENLSKEEFVKQADQICGKTEKRQLVLVNKFEESKSGKESQVSPAKAEEELVTFAGLPPVKQQLQELSQLPAPQSGGDQVDGYLQALSAGVAAVEKNPSLLLKLESDPFAKAITLAKQVGFKVCSGA